MRPDEAHAGREERRLQREKRRGAVGLSPTPPAQISLGSWIRANPSLLSGIVLTLLVLLIVGLSSRIQGGPSEDEVATSLEEKVIDWTAADNSSFAESAKGDPLAPMLEFQVDRGYTTCREGPPDRYRSEGAEWLCVSRITDIANAGPSKVIHTWTVERTEGGCWDAELVEVESEQSGHVTGPDQVRELGANEHLTGCTGAAT